jgi:L-alanine-DL-glutamate epimerase-like enolase superfamily enzyme
MKITDVKPFACARKFLCRSVFSRSGVRNNRSTTLIKVETDDGTYGLGSASGNGDLIEFIVARVLKPMMVGMDPTEIDEIWDTAYVRGGHKEFGTRGIGVVALSGIDVALWDILGKVRGVPLYQLLGGKVRDKVPVYATALYPEDRPGSRRARIRRARISRC